MQSIDRVFFHELGHFVANQINFECFGGTDAESFKIYPCENNPDFYCGGFTPYTPVGVNKITPPPHERRPQFISYVSYGCIFQSAYLKYPSLDDCLEINGRSDAENIAGIVRYYPKIKTQIWQCIKKHFTLISKNAFLKEFMNLNPSDYLISSSNNSFYVDIEVLKSSITPLLNNFKQHYCSFVQELQKLIMEQTTFEYRP